MTPLLHLHVLASGSKGNAAVISGPNGAILIDCGIGPRVMAQRAASCGCDLTRIAAVLVTHEHSDHVSGLSVFASRASAPLFATAGTVAARSYLAELPFTVIAHDETFATCGIAVTAFPTSHDVADPVGFRFAAVDDDGCVADAIGWCTDTGVLTSEARQALTGCRIIGIEANHDVDLLRHGRYPAYLKARVGGERGHMSNAQTTAALPQLMGDDTETVVALHLSQDNNRPDLCVRTLADAVGATMTSRDDATAGTFAEARTADGRLTIVAAAQDRAFAVY